MQTVVCKNCEKSGILPVTLSFIVKVEQCSECNHTEQQKWDFHFCCLDCIEQWYVKNKVHENGLPCQYCNETGFIGGFESNGKCHVCNGEKAVRKTIMNVPWESE